LGTFGVDTVMTQGDFLDPLASLGSDGMSFLNPTGSDYGQYGGGGALASYLGFGAPDPNTAGASGYGIPTIASSDFLGLTDGSGTGSPGPGQVGAGNYNWLGAPLAAGIGALGSGIQGALGSQAYQQNAALAYQYDSQLQAARLAEQLQAAQIGAGATLGAAKTYAGATLGAADMAARANRYGAGLTGESNAVGHTLEGAAQRDQAFNNLAQLLQASYLK
jgi:hypothetical protein